MRHNCLSLPARLSALTGNSIPAPQPYTSSYSFISSNLPFFPMLFSSFRQPEQVQCDVIVSCSIQPCSCPYIAATPPWVLLTPLPVLLVSRQISKPTCRRIQIGLVAFFWLFSTVYFPTCESRRNQCDSCQCRWHLILLIKSDIIWWQNLMTVDHTSYETDDSWSQLKVTESGDSWSQLIKLDDILWQLDCWWISEHKIFLTSTRLAKLKISLHSIWKNCIRKYNATKTHILYEIQW